VVDLRHAPELEQARKEPIEECAVRRRHCAASRDRRVESSELWMSDCQVAANGCFDCRPIIEGHVCKAQRPPAAAARCGPKDCTGLHWLSPHRCQCTNSALSAVDE
jgi:hypothetical protein